MKMKLAVPAVAILTCALALPALACGNKSTTAAGYSAKSAAWAGAWLQRSASGDLTVAAVAEGSPAARSGLRAGDVVVAVNGREVPAYDGATCLTKYESTVGAAVAYTVQRGEKTKVVKVKLEKLPAQATEKFADREPTYDPGLAAVVITSID